MCDSQSNPEKQGLAGAMHIERDSMTTYSVSINNCHAVDCSNKKKMIETAKNICCSMDNLEWAVVIVRDEQEIGDHTYYKGIKHMRIDIMQNKNKSFYDALEETGKVRISARFPDVGVMESIVKGLYKIWE